MSLPNYKEYYNTLLCHLISHYNIKVIEEPFVEDAWYPHLNLIYINKNLKYRERLFCLLHESGHAVIDNDIRHKNVTCFNKNSPHHIRSKKGYVHTLNEEILAWNYGKSLAQQLGFYIEEDRFDIYMSDCIMSYIKSGLLSLYGKHVNAESIRTRFV